jgi:hypothetical protein
MINLELLSKEALREIKSKWNLPERGFLTGGSLANLIWEKISGKEAIINDLDIFMIESDDNFSFNDFIINSKERIIFEDYSGISMNIYDKCRYAIKEVTRDGIFNFIKYSSNIKDPQIIIDSFDINCCQVGYQIETDKFYWTKEFVEFLETGQLKLTTLSTPAHSAIRLAKKSIELGVCLPSSELQIIQIVLSGTTPSDLDRVRFKSKYVELFKKYENLLSDKFILERDSLHDERIKEYYGHESELFLLKPTEKYNVFFIGLSVEMLYFFRNIWNNSNLEKIWKKIWLLWDRNLENYLDVELKDEEVNMLAGIIQHAPNAIKNLKGFTVSKQIEIINNLFQKCKDNPIVAVSIMEESKNLGEIDLDNELEIDMLKVSVRRKNFVRVHSNSADEPEIIIDPKNKVSKIFGQESIKPDYYGTEPDQNGIISLPF